MSLQSQESKLKNPELAFCSSFSDSSIEVPSFNIFRLPTHSLFLVKSPPHYADLQPKTQTCYDASFSLKHYLMLTQLDGEIDPGALNEYSQIVI